MSLENNVDLVEILVPRSLVMDVYGFIAEKSGSLTHKAQRRSDAAKATELSGKWDASLIKRMYQESDKNMRAILDYLAARSGETVTALDLVNVLKEVRDDKKATRLTLAGTLGAFGRRVKSRYKRDGWPFEASWSHEEGQNHYRMSGEVASQLRVE